MYYRSLIARCCALGIAGLLATTLNSSAAEPARPPPPTAELEQLDATLQQLQASTTNAPAVQAVLTEIQSTYRELEAAQTKMRELQGKLRQTMQAEMLKQNPQAKQLYERREQLQREMRAESFLSNMINGGPPR